ncbi:MAG: hypothetical protein ACR2KT_15380 [Methylocella sp.]|nr:MAG: hypothetical protein DLM68_17725 [Hyphomicrobiales bacterium]
MSLLAKISIFCAFLVAYSVWLVVIYKLTLRTINAVVTQRDYLLVTAATGLLGSIGIFVFVWLLSGFLDSRFVGLLLAGQLLSPALTGVL